MLWIIYKYYKESFWANVAECTSLLCPIIAAAIYNLRLIWKHLVFGAA